jgi:hypothetical protein
MLWARLAVALEGARFARAPIPVLHDRNGPGRSSFDLDKLLDDARGSSVVAALDSLLAEGALVGRRPLPQSAVARAGSIYVAHARARLIAIQSSEDRVRSLLDQILSRLSPPDRRAGFLGDPAHSTSIKRLTEHAAHLRAAYTQSLEAIDPAADQPDIERFFLELPARLKAFRASALYGINGLSARSDTIVSAVETSPEPNP